MCKNLLANGRKEPNGELGKTIVFCVNQNHATAVTKILNSLQPESAVTITSRVDNSSTIAKDFRDGKRKEKIAVSVDMLSTGYNCRDLLNVALFRPIFSPTEYIQIKGRGTRLFEFIIINTHSQIQFVPGSQRSPTIAFNAFSKLLSEHCIDAWNSQKRVGHSLSVLPDGSPVAFVAP